MLSCTRPEMKKWVPPEPLVRRYLAVNPSLTVLPDWHGFTPVNGVDLEVRLHHLSMMRRRAKLMNKACAVRLSEVPRLHLLDGIER